MTKTGLARNNEMVLAAISLFLAKPVFSIQIGSVLKKGRVLAAGFLHNCKIQCTNEFV